MPNFQEYFNYRNEEWGDSSPTLKGGGILAPIFMMKTLIIVDHPFYDQSVVNRRWLDEVRKYPDEFLVHNLQSSYPRSSIDPALEHSIIDNNGTIVLQFPMFWFNTPPMLKSWVDTILTQGWAYAGGKHLENRNIAFAVTCGAQEESYRPDGDIGISVENFLNSYISAFKRCHANYVGSYIFYGAKPVKGELDMTVVAQSARDYVDFLRQHKQETKLSF